LLQPTIIFARDQAVLLHNFCPSNLSKFVKLGSYKGLFCAIMAPNMNTRLVENNGKQAI